MKIKIVKSPTAILPSKAHANDAGYDLFADLIANVVIDPQGGRAMIPTGIYIELPDGYEAQIRPRSGQAAKQGITVLNAPGTVDAGYRGEVKVILHNTSIIPVVINHGDKIAQMVIQKVEDTELVEADSLSDSKRGANGFGSTGT